MSLLFVHAWKSTHELFMSVYLWTWRGRNLCRYTWAVVAPSHEIRGVHFDSSLRGKTKEVGGKITTDLRPCYTREHVDIRKNCLKCKGYATHTRVTLSWNNIGNSEVGYATHTRVTWTSLTLEKHSWNGLKLSHYSQAERLTQKSLEYIYIVEYSH